MCKVTFATHFNEELFCTYAYPAPYPEAGSKTVGLNRIMRAGPT